MTDKFSLLPIRKLLQLSLNHIDNKNGFLSLPEELFFTPRESDSFRMTRFGQLLETPLGVAAGPHTQLSQNIVASWLAGARYIELKTVQTLDKIEVSKPCIDMQDEGYNCEWSQELTMEESFDQYLDAWIVLHILKHKLGHPRKESPGFIFNMSVGYDLKGIMKENVQWFFSKMADASLELKAKLKEISDIYPKVEQLKISSTLSNNITLSTMHGCPAGEIQQIAEYLISERGLHTTVKLNPTLLGKKELSAIIANSGFDTIVPDEAYTHDLKYADAIKMIKTLSHSAKKKQVFFGLKLTNTLESQNHKEIFDKAVDMMYGSGKMLHPISVNTARKIQTEFNGQLDISFSGGADAFNVSEILNAGLSPVTVSSDLLKPGGYGRLAQYFKNISGSQFPKRDSLAKQDAEIALNHLNKYADEVKTDPRYKKTDFKTPSIKTQTPLSIFDCAFAPCESTCPTNQDIPSYMYYTARGEYDKAFDVISKTNPFPHTTGLVCDHECETKCTRINYDSPLKIREIKHFIAEKHKQTINPEAATADDFIEKNIEAPGKKVAVIGAGPSGLSCAYFLKKAGFSVKIYELSEKAGGMPAGVIPKFRLPDEAIETDINSITELGVEIAYNQNISAQTFKEIRAQYNYVYIATGAQQALTLPIEGADTETLTDPLKLLDKVKQSPEINIGKNIAVIGGGNTAMDVARTAMRLVGSGGKVSILYRRTIKQMPADADEIKEALEENIQIIELVSPVKITKTNQTVQLFLERMELGEKDAGGRRRPIAITGSEFSMEFDTVVPAVGQNLDIDFADDQKLQTENKIHQTQLNNVFIGGDAMRGASSLIKAIADGRKTAQTIIDKEQTGYDTRNKEKRSPQTVRNLMIKKAERIQTDNNISQNHDTLNFEHIHTTFTESEAKTEAERCLLCDELCNICTTVCPNFALLPYEVPVKNYQLQQIKDGKITDGQVFSITQNQQIIHIADFCNACGNCNSFCPTADAPYKTKPHLYLNFKDFADNKDGYFYNEKEKTLYYKLDGFDFKLQLSGNKFNYETDNITAVLDSNTLNIIEYTGIDEPDFKQAVVMKQLFEAVNQIF